MAGIQRPDPEIHPFWPDVQLRGRSYSFGSLHHNRNISGDPTQAAQLSYRSIVCQGDQAVSARCWLQVIYDWTFYYAHILQKI